MAGALKKAISGVEIVWVGCDNGLECQVVPEAGYPLETLPIRGLPRKASLEVVDFASKFVISSIRARRLIKKHNPNIVVGMGGFASFPMVMSAKRQGIPTVIHEQNAILGLANRRLSSHVDMVALAYEDSQKVLDNAQNVKVVGNPVRPDVVGVDRTTALQKLGLADGQKTLLIFGGSRGALKINEAAISAYDLLRQSQDLQIVHIAGTRDFDDIKEKLNQAKRPDDSVNYHLFPYIEEIGLAYSVADLAVTRAGASTAAELTASGLPALLVPYPWATDNHQLANAKRLESAGAASIILDESLNAQLLWQAVSDLIYNPLELKKMSECSKILGRPQAANELASTVMETAGKVMAKTGRNNLS